MTVIPINFCGQAYKDRSPDANAQTCVNFYPVRSPTSSEPQRIILHPTPGYSLFMDTTALGITGTGAIRAVFQINGETLFVVSGSKLLKITRSGAFYSATAAGTLNTSTGRCSLVCNTVEIAISDGTYGYVYNLSSAAFSVVGTSGSFPATGVTNLAFIDGYVLAGKNASNQVIQSDLLAAGTFGALSFAAVTTYPDYQRAVYSDQNQLYIFGPTLTEVRYNAGSTPFAFERQAGVLIQAGCVAWPTIVKVGNSILWLASDDAGKAYVASLEGYSPKVLSTTPINEAIERYSTISDAFGYTYREGGSQFYCITFPSENVTWAYDVGSGFWHRRSDAGGRALPDHCIVFGERALVGDSTGKLYWMRQDYAVGADGNGIARERTCEHIDAKGNGFFVHELNVDIQAGIGTASGQGSDPLGTLKVSRDGGHTWVSAGTARMGKLGEYKTRLTWRNLGRARPRMAFRLECSEPVGPVILGASARVSPASK